MRIIYVHVPADWMSMFIYTCIALAGAHPWDHMAPGSHKFTRKLTR